MIRAAARPVEPARARFERALRTLLWGEISLLALFAAVLFFSQGRVCLVFSDSMAPTLRTGDLIFLRRVAPEQIHPGMVVSYWWDDKLITHRVLSLQGGVLHTAGDAAAQPDGWTAPLASVAGTPVLRVPLAGYLLLWMRHPAGWAVTVILPALLVAAGFGRDILKLLRTSG